MPVMRDAQKSKEQPNKEADAPHRGVACLKQAERECEKAIQTLREGERKFRELADLFPEAMFEIDTKGKFTFVNRCAFELVGYSQEDLEQNENMLAIFVPKDRVRVIENIGRVMCGEELGAIEYTLRRKDGSTFPVTIHSSAIQREGEVIGLRGLMIDITERQRTEEALRAT